MSDADDKPKSHGRLSIRASLKPRDLLEEPRVVKGAFTVKIITLFPEAFPGTLGLSLTGKALDFGLWQLETIDLREFGEGKHRNVDDTPAGGGAGMVLRADGPGAVVQAQELLTQLHWRHPLQDAVLENLPADDPLRPAYEVLGYLRAFTRVEMVLGLSR